MNNGVSELTDSELIAQMNSRTFDAVRDIERSIEWALAGGHRLTRRKYFAHQRTDCCPLGAVLLYRATTEPIKRNRYDIQAAGRLDVPVLWAMCFTDALDQRNTNAQEDSAYQGYVAGEYIRRQYYPAKEQTHASDPQASD